MSAGLSQKKRIYPEIKPVEPEAKTPGVTLKVIPGHYQPSTSYEPPVVLPLTEFKPLAQAYRDLYSGSSTSQLSSQNFVLPRPAEAGQSWFRVAQPAVESGTFEPGHKFNLLSHLSVLTGYFVRSKASWLLAGVILGGLVIIQLLALVTAGSKPQNIYNFGIVASGPNAPANKPLTTPPAVSTAAGQLEGKPTVTTARIEQVLLQYNSPAVGAAQSFYDLGVKYGIDPAYALAFFIHESTAGTKGVAVTTRSIGNIRQTPNSGFEAYQGYRKYPTWEAGIEDWYKLISNLYIKGWGLRTVDKIIPKYAPTADNNNELAYINHVNSLVEGWRSN